MSENNTSKSKPNLLKSKFYVFFFQKITYLTHKITFGIMFELKQAFYFYRTEIKGIVFFLQ